MTSTPKKEDGNDEEHALNWILENVEKLCDEFAGQLFESGNDEARNRLETSANTILDKLEMPTIAHAKNEVMLLTRLHEGLSRLVQHCENVFESPCDVTERLKTFREEMQKLFLLTPVCGPPTKKKVQIAIDLPLMDKVPQTRDDPKAERTKTPTLEHRRPGHEQERTDRIEVLDEKALRKVQESIEKDQTDEVKSSTESRATKTPNPKGEVVDERSQNIWTDADVEKQFPFKSRVKPKTSSPVAALVGSRIKSSVNPSDRGPVTGEVIRRVRVSSSTKSVESTGSRGVTPNEEPLAVFVRKMILTFAILAMPFLLLFTTLICFEINLKFHGGRHRSGLHTILYQLGCNVANVFCENFGTACFEYCCSGLQREKWRCVQ